MERVSRLELVRLYRPFEESGGGQQSERESQDFSVDGQSLARIAGGDIASRLGWRPPDQARNRKFDAYVVAKLLLLAEPDFPGGRYALYICPECADFGCGVLSAVIERQGERIVWRDFGWQNDYEDEVYRDEYGHIGPFTFDAAEYEGVLRGYLGE